MLNSVISETIAGTVLGGDDAGHGQPSVEGEGFVPLSFFVDRLETLRQRSEGGLYAWTVGEIFTFDMLGDLGEIIACAPTLGHAMRQLAQGLPMLQSGAETSFTVIDDEARLSYRVLDPEIWPRRGDAEITLSLAQNICMRFGMPRGALRQVGLEYIPDRDPSECARHLRVMPRFDQTENYVAFPARFLSNPSVTGSAGTQEFSERSRALLDRLSRRQSRLATGELVRARILRHIGRGSLGQASIASELGMSDRSLRRKLSVEATSYHDILEECRRAQGEALLTRTERSLGDIAHALGYSDQTAFSRAFSRWFSMCPSEIRKSARQPAAGDLRPGLAG